MNKEKTRKGSLHIGRVTVGGSLEPDYIRIEIEDELSNIHFLEAKLSLEDLAKTLTGGSNVPITYVLWGIKDAGNIGKQAENKTEVVTVAVKDWISGPTPEEIGDALIPYMMDGWVCRESDFKNHHRWVRCDEEGMKKYRVCFFRWVDPLEEDGCMLVD